MIGQSLLATPCRRKKLSTVAILGFQLQFGLYHVVAPLSFLRSNHHCIIVTCLVFLFLADLIFYSVFVCGSFHHRVSNFRTFKENENWCGVQVRGGKRLLVWVIGRLEKPRLTPALRQNWYRSGNNRGLFWGAFQTQKHGEKARPR